MRNLKKLLAVIVAICILATLTVPAFAAGSFTYETQAKSLYDMKLFVGNSASEYVPALDSSLTREQGIILLVRLFGKEADAKALTGATEALAAYTDAADIAPWALNYVAYAVKTGMVLGATTTTIDPQGNLSGNTLATMILRNLGYTVDAVGFNTAAATLQTKGGTLTAAEAAAFATKELIRDDAVGMMFSSLLAVDKDGKTAISNLISAGVVTEAQAAAAGLTSAVSSVKVTDTNKITVTFTGTVDPAKVKVTLKQGLAIQYTTAAFATDNKSVVLTAPVAIAAGDYSVVVSGLTATDIATPITIGAATPTSLEIGNTQVAIGASSTVTFSVKNQYGTDMGVIGSNLNGALIVTAYDVTANKAVTVGTNANSATKSEVALDLTVGGTPTFAVGDDVRIIINYKGLTVVKTVKIVAQASVSSITLGAVAPKAGTTRITEGDTLEIPYTLKDQFGADATLALPSSTITFISSDSTVVSTAIANFYVANGKLTFKALKAGTATITAIINASGSVSSTTVVVNGNAAVKSIAIASPSVLLAAGETATLALTGVDQYGALTTNLTGVLAKTSDTKVTNEPTVAGGKLSVKGIAEGTAVITLYNGDTTYGTITLRFEKAAVPTAIIGLKTATTMEVGAVQPIALTDVMVKDQYGRDFTLTANNQLVITEVTDNTTVTLTAATAPATGYSNQASLTAGSEAVQFALANNSASYTANYTVVAKSSIVSYAVTGVKPVYADTTTSGKYTLALGVEGKLADGTKVVLVSGKIANATSGSQGIATVTSAGVVTGKAAGTSLITLYDVYGAELANATITVSTETPKAVSATFAESSYTVVKAATQTIAVEVLDQYGVVLANDGWWTTSDPAVATVTGGVVKGVAAGQVTIKYITSNNVVAQASVTVVE